MPYVEIIDNKIIKHYNVLPNTYKNISNFFALEANKIQDLTWSGNPGISFYEYVEDKPAVLENNTVLSGPTYTIDHENHKVIGSYTVEEQPITNPSIPESVSARQVRLWLVQNAISLDMVANAINSIEDVVTKNSIAIEWEYAPYIERKHPMLVPLAQILGLTEADIDRAFIEASNI